MFLEKMLNERDEKKDTMGGFQTEHAERHQDRSVVSVFQHQPEETIRNGVQEDRTWLDGTPEEKAERKTAPTPSLSSQGRKPAMTLVVWCFVRARLHLNKTAVWQQP